MKTALPVLLTAILIGLLHLVPHVLMYRYVDPDRVYLPFSFAETLYAAQVKEVMEGHLSVGDPQFWEHKYTFPSLFPMLPIWLIALLCSVSGSVILGFWVSDFIFPAILFLVLFGLTYTILQKKWPAIFIAVLTIFLYQLTAKFPPLFLGGWYKFLQQVILQEVSQPLPFYRTPNPQISFIILSIAIWNLLLLWHKFSWKTWSLTLISCLLLYTVYFYHLTFILGMLGILEVIAIITRRRKHALSFLGMLLILFIVGSGYYFLTRQPQYITLNITGGRFDARYFDYLYSLRYGFIVLLIVLFRFKLSNQLFIFLIAFAVSSILVMNLQLLSGWTVQPGHWPQTTLEPIMMLIIGVLIFNLISSVSFKQQFSMYGTVLILMYGMFIQLRFAKTHVKDWSIQKDLERVLIWMDQNTLTQSVVLSLDIATMAYTPIMTSNNIFLPVEEYHYATVDEIWERIMYAYKLYSVSPEMFDPQTLAIPTFFELTYNVNKYKHEKLDQYEPEMINQILRCYPSLCSGLYALPKRIIEVIKDKYLTTSIKDNPYRIDYAIFSSHDIKLGGHQPSGEIVYSAGDYKVIKIH